MLRRATIILPSDKWNDVATDASLSADDNRGRVQGGKESP